MAFPKKQADPSQGNRAATIRFGTPEPEKIDIEALQKILDEIEAQLDRLGLVVDFD